MKIHQNKPSLQTVRQLIRGLVSVASIIFTFSATAQLPNSFKVNVTNGDGAVVEMDLHKHSIRSADFRVQSWDSTVGYTEEHTAGNPVMPVRTYRGFITQNPNEIVTAIVYPDNTMAATAHIGFGEVWAVSGVDVTIELGNGTATIPAPAPLAPGAAATGSMAGGVPTTYLPPVGLYVAHGVYDIPSSQYQGSVDASLAWLEHGWNSMDLFNARDGKVSLELSEVIVRKTQFYTPTSGGDLNGALRSEWLAQGQSVRGFIATAFPTGFSIAGGYATGGNFYTAGGEPLAVNAMHHEVAHLWGAKHNWYGKDTMGGGGALAHAEMNAMRVHAKRQAEIDEGDISQLASYSTNLHPKAFLDLASTLENTAVNISPLDNDWDANGDTISIKTYTTTTAQGGTVTESGGVLTYTPATGYVGKDIIVYEVEDNNAVYSLYSQGLIHIEVINQGLAGHWAMEDATGTSATDSSGNGHTGELSSADFSVNVVDGPVGKALRFPSGASMACDETDIINESEKYYPLESYSSNFFDPMDQSYTASAWFQLEDGASNVELFSKTNGGFFGLVLYGNTSGMTARVKTWNGNAGYSTVSSGPLVEGAWYHIAMVIDRSDDMLRLYLNGAEVGTAASLPADEFIFMGRQDLKVGGGASVLMDEVKIHTKALNVTELQAMYNEGSVPAAASAPLDGALNLGLNADIEWLVGNPSYQHDVYFGTDAAAVAAATTASPEYKGRQSATTFDPGLLDPSATYFWRIDEVDGGTIIPSPVWRFYTAANSLANGLVLHLTMDNDDTQTANGLLHSYDDIALPASDFWSIGATAGAAGVIGESVDLTGTADSLRSHVATPVATPASGNLAVSFWVNTTSTSTNAKLFDIGAAVFLAYDNGDIRPVFDGSSSGASLMTAGLNDGQWHHVVAQNDGGTTTIYVDGVVIGTQSESVFDISSLGRQMAIGSTYNSTGENLEASFDDFAVWQRALSSAEIAVIHSEGLAGRSFNTEPVLINTSFEVAEGFSGYTANDHSSLGTKVDNDGVTWTETVDARIWNRSDIPPDGVQALAFGLGATLSQCDVSIPGTTHGIGSVSFDYASFSSGTDVTFRLLYNSGSGWVEAWSTQLVGSNPGTSTKPWATAEVAVNVPGDVDLRWEMNGPSGGLIDNVRVTGIATNTAPVFTSDPINLANVEAWTGLSGTLSGSATDADRAAVIYYSKLSGPAWLSVAQDGTLSGSPAAADVGANVFTVQASDGNGGIDTATLNVTVEPSSIGLTVIFQGNQIYDGASYINGWSEVTGGHVAETLNGSDLNRNQNNGSGATWLEGISSSLDGGTTTWSSGNDGDWTWETRMRINDSSNGFAIWLGTGNDVALIEIYNDRTQDDGATSFNASHTNNDGAYHIWRVAHDSSESKYHVWRDGVLITPAGGAGYDKGDNDDRMIIGDFTSGSFGNAHHIDIDYIAYDQTGIYSPTNTAPVASDNSASIAEDVSVGAAVVTVAVSDADIGDTYTLEISGGNTGNAFAIDNNGNITTTTALDFETTASYSLTVTARDARGLTDTAAVTVTVTNVTTSDDSDSNDLNDDWEVQHYGSTGSVLASADTDGDGFSAFQEMVFGMNPTVNDSGSAPIQQNIVADKLEVKFRRPDNYKTLNVTYALQSCDDLQSASWADDTSVTPTVTTDGTNEWVTYKMPLPSGAAARKFYRCSVSKKP